MRARAALLAGLIAAAANGCARAPDPYAAYRQTRTEDIPGTLDWELEPAGDVSPAVGPEEAYARVFQAGRNSETLVVLGRVRNVNDGTTGPPAWIFITPHMCFATAKGDLVSPGRVGNGCVQDNLYVQGIDAATGEVLGGFPAFDTPEGWVPARAGTPEVVVAHTQGGATRLH